MRSPAKTDPEQRAIPFYQKNIMVAILPSNQLCICYRTQKKKFSKKCMKFVDNITSYHLSLTCLCFI